MPVIRTLIVILAAGLTVPSAWAEDPGGIPTGRDPATPDTRLFEKLDGDGNGYLSDEEVRKSQRSGLITEFDRLDVNGDGFLTKQEYDRL